LRCRLIGLQDLQGSDIHQPGSQTQTIPYGLEGLPANIQERAPCSSEPWARSKK